MQKKKDMCEVCGEREARFIITIEGATMNACAVCAKGAKILNKKPDEEIEKGVRVVETGVVEEDIIEGYGEIVRKARERLGLSRQELARKISESESYLEHIEKEKMRPTIKTAKKLERTLGIKLIEKTTEVIIEKPEKKTKEELTLGDFVEEKK
ncbi:MAG: multiprotein bridging factor aMBF1 [Candidatus Anstonellales archaeon]